TGCLLWRRGKTWVCPAAARPAAARLAAGRRAGGAPAGARGRKTDCAARLVDRVPLVVLRDAPNPDQVTSKAATRAAVWDSHPAAPPRGEVTPSLSNTLS